VFDMSLDDDLDAIASVKEFEFNLAADALVTKWANAGVGPEMALEPVLRFFERHPNIDHGVPGTLTHFIEQVQRTGYDQKVIASVTRSPTMMTVLLLNRLINGTPTQAGRRPLISCLRLTRQKIHDPTLSIWVEELLTRISQIHPGE